MRHDFSWGNSCRKLRSQFEIVITFEDLHCKLKVKNYFYKKIDLSFQVLHIRTTIRERNNEDAVDPDIRTLSQRARLKSSPSRHVSRILDSNKRQPRRPPFNNSAECLLRRILAHSGGYDTECWTLENFLSRGCRTRARPSHHRQKCVSRIERSGRNGWI